MDGNSVKINVPYLMELVEKSGLSRGAFSNDVLLRGKNYISGVIRTGSVGKMMVDIIVKTTNADREKLLTHVPYNPDDYKMHNFYGNGSQKEEEKDGTIAEYIQLMASGLTEVAKNQKALGELTVEISKLTVDNRRFSDETGKLLQVILEKLNRIEKDVTDIHKELH